MLKPTHLKHIGQNIEKLRKLRSMTQAELADSAAIRAATLSDIEAGKADFRLNTLVRIASALKCSLDLTFTPLK